MRLAHTRQVTTADYVTSESVVERGKQSGYTTEFVRGPFRLSPRLIGLSYTVLLFGRQVLVLNTNLAWSVVTIEVP